MKNVIEYTIDTLKREVKRLEHDYKKVREDASYRTVYPYSREGIIDTLEIIIHRAFELKVCNECPNFYNCDHTLHCIESIDGSASMAKEYGDRCWRGELDRLSD